MEYLCELNGIVFVKQEESYTSQASFWDRDNIPVYNADNPQSYKFSGIRIRRGLYRNADGTLLNADVNGALNILRKSSVVDLTVLYSRGDVDTPVRIRIAGVIGWKLKYQTSYEAPTPIGGGEFTLPSIELRINDARIVDKNVELSVHWLVFHARWLWVK